MASGLNSQQQALMAWLQQQQQQDPSTFGWTRSGINVDNYAAFKPQLQAAGLWSPAWDAAANWQGPSGDSDYSPNGARPAAPDLSSLSGYSVGSARGQGYDNINALFDAQGNPIGLDTNSVRHGMHANDYATLAAVIGGGIAGGYGLAANGIGAGATGTLGTIGAGAGEVGSLGTVGQFAMPELGTLAAPSATMAGETAGLTAGQVGAMGAGGTGAISAGGTGVMGSLPTTALGSSALPATGYATGSTLGATALPSTMGTVAGTGLGEYAGAIKAAASLVGGLGSAYASGQAGQQASQLQQQAATAGQAQLAPYAQAGTGALKAQQDLAGLNGPQAQQAAIQQLQQSPAFTSQLDLGNRSILANASATGGLRGGNTQAALAQFSPALLAQTINDQYGRLGGLTQTGLSAAGGVSNLIQQGGAAAAGGALAQGKQQAGYWGALGNAAGLYAGLSGW